MISKHHILFPVAADFLHRQNTASQGSKKDLNMPFSRDYCALDTQIMQLAKNNPVVLGWEVPIAFLNKLKFSYEQAW